MVTALHTAVFTMDNQPGQTVEQRALCSMLCGSLEEREVRGRTDACVSITGFLCSSPETSTLFIGFTPIQNRKFEKI